MRIKPAAVTFLLLLLASTATAQWNPLNPVKSEEKQSDGVLLRMQTGLLRLQVCTDSIVRILYTPSSSFPRVKQYAVIKTGWPATQFSVDSAGKDVTLSTSQLKVTVTRKDGTMVFSDSRDIKLMQSSGGTMSPVVVNGERTYHAEEFITTWGSPEGFFGLGQHQAGVWNYRGESVDISQDNSNISIPMLVSTAGYGLYWDNPSRSRFNNRFMQSLYISSEAAEQIDYYFIYGPEFDRIVAAYRELTGAAPLFGRWAYGFWQCKNRYESQQELLEVAHKYREMHIPVDNIVQDWFWWNKMGDFEFNNHYPDPKSMIDDLHENHFHLMISVWPYFDPGSRVYREMDKLHYFIDRTKSAAFHPAGMALYDASNPAARKYYWGLIDSALFNIGADAWWLDTTEPETEGRETNILASSKMAIGNGARYANLFPLMTTQAVYDGQRASTSHARVFILSRSAYAGIQRHATAAWSGDINSDWETFKRQIPAGLNLMVSGVPYWTTDIGGFTDGNPDDPAYRELFIRWFEYGAFCPIFRVHGSRPTELWSYGAEAQEILTRYDTLRYRLMPYIYSLAWQVTNAGYTLMRPLAMDYREDVTARNIGDQFTFGPALLVSPVTDPGEVQRRVYLPGTNWVNFWTGEKQPGDRFVMAAAPLETLPLFVRAGSILPMGPAMEYASESAANPIELRVYAGADADFTLYEDDGLTYDYEKGADSTIPIRWDNAGQALTIGPRHGSFPGMLKSRTFNIVWVGPGHGVGGTPSGTVDKTISYDGTAVTVQR